MSDADTNDLLHDDAGDQVARPTRPTEGTSGLPPEERLGRRLDHLFETIPAPDGGKWTNVDVAAQLREHGIQTSAPYISMLRRGKRGNPALSIMTGIARIFDVPVAYFYDDDIAERLDRDLALLSGVRRLGLEKIALRLEGLSPEVIDEVLKIVDATLAIQNLKPTDGSS